MRRRILDATHVVLSRSGHRNLQLSDVAAQADVSRPTLYRYFGSRGGLLEAFSRTSRTTSTPVSPRRWRGSRPRPAGCRTQIHRGIPELVLGSVGGRHRTGPRPLGDAPGVADHARTSATRDPRRERRRRRVRGRADRGVPLPGPGRNARGVPGRAAPRRGARTPSPPSAATGRELTRATTESAMR